LAAAAAVRGFWPAGDLRREAMQAVYGLKAGDDAPPDPLPPYPVLSGPEAATARLTLSYGCPFPCAFCFEGYERRPYRPVPLGELLQEALRLKRSTGAHTLELASFNVNTHPELPSLLLEGNRLFAQVNFMSQRADILNDTPGLLELELAAGKRSYTLGVEGISGRLRAFLSKRLEENAVRQLLARLLAGGAREAKLFYLLTGYETPDDFEEFRAFLGWLRGRRRERGSRLIFSFNRLVRMPFTPLAHDRLFLEEGHWEPLVREARAAVETVGEFRMASSWPEYAASQALALGGYWLHEPLQAMAEAGLCYDRELPAAAWRLLNRWLEAHPREAGELVSEKPPDYVFPLDFVRTPVHASARHAQYLRSSESLNRGKPDRSPIDPARMRLPPGALQAMAELMRRKARLKPVYLTLEVPREAAGGCPEWLDAWMLARILESHPALIDNLLSVREILFAGQGPRDRYPPWYGRSVFSLTAWDPEALQAALQNAPSEHTGPPPSGGQTGPTPSALEVAEIRLRLELPERFFPQAGERLAEYLAAEHAPATARRLGPDLVLEPGARALKRKLLLAGVWRAAAEEATGGGELRVAELTIGPRFRLRRYLGLFPEPQAWRRALVEVLDFAWASRRP
jgi:hypothetical protein